MIYGRLLPDPPQQNLWAFSSMPFPFTLPTVSPVSFSTHYISLAYPSLPLACSTHRGILRDSLKSHKRLPAPAQGANIKHIISVTTEYLSYLQFLYKALQLGDVSPIPTAPEIGTAWTPTLASTTRFGVPSSRERARGRGLEYEIFWAYSTLAYAHSIQARVLLIGFLSPPSSSPSPETSSTSQLLPQAINHVLTSASIFNYLLSLPPPKNWQPGNEKNTLSLPHNISQPMLSSLASISLASATLLAVLKTDPYPTYLAITSNTRKNDNDHAYSKEYLYNPPNPPKGVKALLFSRLCVAASEHATKAQGAISDIIRAGTVNEDYVRYIDELRRAAKARGCRFLGVDAEAQGRLGEGIAWIKLARETLTGSVSASSSSTGEQEGKGKKTLASRMEKLRLSKSPPSPLSTFSSHTAASGNGGGLPLHLDPCTVYSELQVIESLDAKWTKMNDKLIFEKVPPTNSLIAKIPGGREVHTVQQFAPVQLGEDSVNQLRRGVSDSHHVSFGPGKGSAVDSSDEEEWRGEGGVVTEGSVDTGTRYQMPGGFY